ncbi:MAG: GNAT family N-acetyltransferase [Deltaproteobacteria bacterium]|nr:GNAT family N-acetyltransferase [Deltaproteobacteria bacterium]
MKLVILTEGGRDRGFGHITRCLSFYEGFRERDFKVTLIVNGDNSVRDLLKGKRHKIFNWLKRRAELFEMIGEADVALVDSYLADRNLYEEVCGMVHYAVYFDDTQRLDYPEGIVINGAIGAEKRRYPEREGVTYLLGIDYTPLRKEFSKVPKRKIRKEVETMMITFGGDDRKITPRILKHLIQTYPGIRKEVVVGRGFKNITEIGNLKGPLTVLLYFPDAQGMKKVMLNADLAISGGGQTLYELARVGVPTIVIGLSDNQLPNIKGWQKAGFISYAGWYRDRGLLDKLKREVDRLLPYEMRKERSKKGRATIDGKGVKRAIDRIVSSLKEGSSLHLREVNEKDCYDLWVWRNQLEARRWSFDKKEIDYSHHVEWFRKKARSKDTRIYVAENDKSEKLGQVRFERKNGNWAFVSINLNPDFLKRSLGNKILSKATLKYLRENRKVVEVRAEILEGNIVSEKAFQKAGYRFCQRAFKAGESIVLYKYTRD